MHHEADKNSMNSCQLQLLVNKHKIKTSWADERIKDEGCGMNIMNNKQARSKFQGVSQVERS